MARYTRTIDLLPEIFQTETNEKFLNATLDQIVQRPQLRRVEGFVGRRTGLGVSGKDSYVLEQDQERAAYQLEPTITYKKTNSKETHDFLTYPGIVDALQVAGANVQRHDRLFDAEYYSWDPFVDYDKHVNFSQYYWLPGGPDSVDVGATEISLTDEYDVTRNEFNYSLSGQAGTNPTITVVRGGNYKFNVQQTGNPFWIQSNPGASGLVPGQPNQSSREVLGVTNNGDDNGIIEFNVPLDTEQNFFLNMDTVAKVDLVTELKFDEVNNQQVRPFLEKYDGIDEVTDLRNRTIIFTNRNPGNGDDSGWKRDDLFDTAPFDDVDTPFARSEEIATKTDRYSVYRIEFRYEEDENSPTFDASGANPIMVLNKVREIPNLKKVHVQYGTKYNNQYFWKTSEGFFEEQPHITAINDTLYYQDANDENRFGIIRVVDAVDQLTLNVGDNILGHKEYTSPTGVKFTNGLKVQFRGRTSPEEYQDKEYYVEGVGTAIKLLAVEDFKTPEPYTISETQPFDAKGYDESPWDASLNAPTEKDYFTINRASPDQNPWSRSNRWFHISVIKASSDYNKTVANLDQTARAKRPIVEFQAGLRLFNFGTEGKRAIDIIDLKQTDALSNVAGKIGYNIDGFGLYDGARVIFAADLDPEVRNKIYEVRLVDPVGITADPTEATEKIIQLIKAEDGEVVKDQTVFLQSGATEQGQSYRYTGTKWVKSQQKTKINQAPLFDIFDKSGNSIGDNTVYPSTNFVGTKLFSYAEGSGPIDSEIGLRLKYQNINNIGDIVFENNLYKDTFVYTINNVSTTTDVATGFVRKYDDRTKFNLKTGWVRSSETTRQSQVFTFTNTNTCVCDVRHTDVDNAVVVYVDNQYLLPSKYTVTRTATSTTVRLNNTSELVHIHVISDQISKVAYYEVPSNLSDNSVNNEFEEVTLGTIRNHYVTLAQSHPELTGTILGENNLRDLGDAVSYGRQIVEQSAPMQFTATFAKDSNINFFDAIEYASNEYEKYKNRLIDALTKNDYQGTAAERLDLALADLNRGKNPAMPFYWSDTMPCGEVYEETVYTITPIDDNVFDLLYTYDFTKANYQGLLVYLNDSQLLINTDYTVATDGPRITINKTQTLRQGDVLKIREYQSTVGSFIPSTPTKLGLFDKFTPKFFTDDSYTTTQQILQGHDGSRTITFGDNRDEVLLEFERRIYNNIKLPEDNKIPMRWYDVVPGAFRVTDYTEAEIVELFGESFLSWVAWNKLDYKTQDYDKNNKKTWNYSSATNRLNGELLSGGWRGNLYKFYDTDLPHLRPWEMFGFSEEPTWWQRQYGPPPYTGENMVLWDDMANGVVAHPDGDYVIKEFKRPRLQEIIPTGDEGDLEASFDVLVQNYDLLSTEKSWQVGDMGPVETAWRRSSAWPFAVMKLLAKTKPAKFFSLMADRDRYKYSADLDQYVFDSRFRLTSNNIEIYGEGTIKHSYINWCVDFARRQGVADKQAIVDVFRNTQVQLVYRVGGFTDKQYLKVFNEKTSPNTLNTNLLLPDESYEILLYSNEPFDEVIYSSVIIQKVANGYAVYGNSKEQLYFKVFKSIPNGNYKNVQVGDSTVRLSLDFSNKEALIPYGYTFTSKGQLVDFLVSYGSWLESKGFVFEDKENEYILNWGQMVSEFLYWNQQGWQDGAIINLNPAANELKVTRPGAVATPILGKRPDEFVLNQNLQPILKDNLVWNRIGNDLSIRTIDEDAIGYVKIKFTSYEHALIFDNTSIFNDLMYDPATGARQQRLRLVGTISDNWDGTVNAPGFIMNQPNVEDWKTNKEYSKGDVVRYKNKYYAALRRLNPAELFDFADWTETEYENVKTGLIPNIALKAQQSEKFYDLSEANLETDADLLGFGLTGFRPRSYMQGLALDDVSQTNVYKNFIGNKGSKQAMDLFKSARLDKELADYNIFENWAVRSGLYGATANRSYIETQLISDKLTGNPATLKITNSAEGTTVNQKVRVDELYKTSYKVLDENILPTTKYQNVEESLPSAGFVNVDDVNIKLFELDDLSVIEENIEKITEGAKIWVAKDNNYSWNVYRTSLVRTEPIRITDNLDETSTVTFNGHHNLNKNDIVVFKFFEELAGAFRVLSTPQLDKVVINLSLPDEITVIEDLGVAFVLQSSKVTQGSDIADLSYIHSVDTGEKIWVDGTQWKVLEKFNPFSDPANTWSKTLKAPEENSGFGTVVSQSPDGLTSLVGAPDWQSGRGSVYVFGQIGTGDIQEGTQLHLGKITSTIEKDIAGYGSSIDSADNGWNIVGAPESKSGEGYAVVINQTSNGVIRETQLLTVPGNGPGDSTASEFGKSVAISPNSKWIFVGAPGDEKVYTYQRREYEQQEHEFLGDGTTTIFDISDYITVDNETQISMNVDNIIQVPVTDYTLSSGILEFVKAPKLGSRVEIVRNYTYQAEGNGSTVNYDISKIYHATSIDKFRVLVNEELLRPYYDYTFNAGTQTITFTLTNKSGTPIAPPSSSLIQVFAEDYYEYVASIDNPGSSNNGFGSSIATTRDGRQIIIGAPQGEGSGGESNVGRVYVFDRDAERFQVKNNTTLSFTTTKSIVGHPTVLVNNDPQIDKDEFLYTGSYTQSSNTITLDDKVVDLGDIVEVETNNFVLAGILHQEDTMVASQFGYAVRVCPTNCSMYAGAPGDSNQAENAGSVTRFVNRSRLYGSTMGSTANPTITAGHSLRINNYYVTATGTTVESYVNDIKNTNIPNVTASAVDGKIKIELINVNAAPAANKLFIYPGVGTIHNDLGLEIFPRMQTINNPYPIVNARFGHALDISSDAFSIVIGSPSGATNLEVTLDASTTLIDAGSTKIRDVQTQSGAVYTYDYLESDIDTFTNPGKFVFGQQITDKLVHPLSEFGISVDYCNAKLLIGSPGFVSDDSINGRIVRFNNETFTPVWQVIEKETPVVDTKLLNSAFIYDRTTDKVLTYLDYIDPLQGKILGAAQQNIDLIIPNDPAQYNNGTNNNFGMTWGIEKLGTIWWDVSTAKFINYNQSTADYRAKRIGNLFPGSTIDIYQWISSDVPPSAYEGEGTVYSTESFSTLSDVREGGAVITKYYYWVKGLTAVNKNSGKTLSPVTIAQYIETPKSSGIPYVAMVDKNTFALFNSQGYILDTDSVLHIEFDKIKTDNNVHVEFELIREKDVTQFLSDNLYRKFLDSFCGVDTAGNIVPDPKLSLTDRRGVDFRPRQTMFVNRFIALENYLTAVNRILLTLPITEIRSYPLLESQETIPGKPSGVWDISLEDIAELSYQNINIAPIGTRYLVRYDENNNGLWSIYTLQSNRTLLLTRVQNFKTTRYWEFADWYATDYNVLDKPTKEVAQYADLGTLTTATVGNVVKVRANAQGKFEIYRLTSTGWDRVGLEKGTIQFKKSIYNYNEERNGFDNEVFDAQYFDQEAVIETRQIVKSINQELFIDNLANHRINLIILMFNYVLSEQKSTDWLVKTSLIDVQHNLRDLKQYPILKRDNQTFIEDYINEVKPYRTQVKEFNLVYKGEDVYSGDATDFDLPAEFDTVLNKYISPRHILDQTGITGEGVYQLDNTIWSTGKYTSWRQNFALSIESVTVIEGGSGYTEPPEVIITGDCDVPAEMTAKVSTAGVLTGIVVDYPGLGYTSTPVITFKGGNGKGAKAVAVTAPGDVRSYKTTIKFDRYEHSTNVVDWTAETVYEQDQLVRFNNKVYSVYWGDGVTPTKTTFDPLDYELVNVEDLSGVDRTMGLYRPGVNYPGLDLSLLVYGTEYPGVNMLGPNFSSNTGYDVGNFDTNPWDNLDFDENGKPSYSETILDAKYQGGDYSGTSTTQYDIQTETKVFDLSVSMPNADHISDDFIQDDPWLWSWDSDFYRPTGGTNVLDPNITLQRGSTYKFRNFTYGHNLWLKSQPLSESEYVQGTIDLYKLGADDGVINNGAKRSDVNDPTPAVVTWTVPLDYPYDSVTIQHSQYGMDDTIKIAGEIITDNQGTTDIDVVGGAFVDSYNSHAPQELVPGAIFDTLNIQVVTRPGEDYTGEGWSGQSQTKFFDFNGTDRTISFDGLVDVPFAVLAYEVDSGKQLVFEYGDTPVNTVDYTIDWNSKTITLTAGRFSAGDIIGVTAHGVGGGNQLFVEDYSAGNYLTTEGTADIVLPVTHTQIKNLEVLVNGEKITNWTLETYDNYHTKIRIGNRDVTGDGAPDVDRVVNSAVGGGSADPEYNNGAIIDVAGDGSDFFKREVTVNGVRVMAAGTVGGQTAVPDAFTEKVARMFELFTDPNGAGINSTFQRNLIKTLSGDAGTYHAGLPTIQRVARGAGADYSPNFLTDEGVASWNLTDLFNTHVQNDMVWYLNSTGSGYGDGDIDAQEVIEHVFHTLHMHGLPADDIKLYSFLAADWQSGDLYAAMEEAYDAGKWDPSGYQVNPDDWKTDADAFEVAAKEYLYLLNFSMFEYTELWDGGSLAPEWSDDMRTQAGILANNPLGYAFHNTYIAPVISKPSLATIRSIFQDGNTPAQDNPALAGESGYVVDVIGGYRALQSTDYIHLAVLGYSTGDTVGNLVEGYNPDVHCDVSYPKVDSMYVTNASEYVYPVTQDIHGHGINPEFAIVTLNGERLRPPEGLEWVGDGSTVDFTLDLQTVLGQGLIADNDLSVYVDEYELTLYADYVLSPYDGSSDRVVTLQNAPAAGKKVKIFVKTAAEYALHRHSHNGGGAENSVHIRSSGLTLKVGDHIAVTGFGFTDELDGMTRVYQGPTQSGFTTRTTFDSVAFDTEAGFDRQVGVSTEQSVYFLGRSIALPERLIVHVNGARKFYGTDWKMLPGDDRYIEFYSLEVQPADIVTVTLRTENIVPNALTFQIFKDMNDTAGIWRCGEQSITTLVQQVERNDDVIYVRDASILPEPDLERNIFGFVMINGERISYRNRDLVSNSISNLRRGIHGTAITTHVVDSDVVNMSKDEYLEWSYTQSLYSNNGLPLTQTDTVPAKFLRRAN